MREIHTKILSAGLLAAVAALIDLAHLPAAESVSVGPGAGDEFELRGTVTGTRPEYVVRNGAQLIVGAWTLQADEIRYNTETGEAQAIGNVLLTRPGFRMLGDSLRYWSAEERFAVENFRFGQPPYYITGRHAAGTVTEGSQMVACDDARIFYGEPGPLTPRASAKALRVFGQDRFEADGLKFVLGFLPLPVFAGISRPLETPNISWETRAGFDDTLGLQLGVGLYTPLTSTLQVGGSIDGFTKRGVLFGPGIRYETESADSAMRGTADIAYISDSGETGVDVLGRPIDRNRSFASWRHQQRAGRRLTLNGELNWWDDSAVLRDFRERLFDEAHEPDSFLEGAWYGSHAIVSAFTRYRPNDFQVAPERLPELRVDLLPTPLGKTGVLLEAQASAAALREKAIDGVSPNRLSDRLDAYAGLSRTIAIAPGTTLTPVAAARVTHYLRPNGDRDHYTRALGEIGFDAQMQAHRTWEWDKPLWGIDGLRHMVEPFLSYRYVPEADKGRAFIPDIDRPAFLTQLQPIGLGERRDIDALGEIDVLRFGFRNFFETRHAEHGVRRLARFDLGADLRLDDSHDGDEFSDIHAELRLTPADWLDWWFFVRIDPDDVRVREFNSRFTLTDGTAWSAGLDVDYLAGDLSQYQVFGRYALNEADEIFAAVRYDGRAQRFNDIEVGFERRLHQNWVVGCTVHVREGTRRESGFGVRLDLRFLEF